MSDEDLPDELTAAIRDHYEPAGFVLTRHATREAESAEYGACRFGISGRETAFRIAKTTPTKIGQFVTIWKREAPGAAIAPLDVSDGVDLLVVSVANAAHWGQFVFDGPTLAERGVFSVNGKGGKRAIRVYPPWSEPIAKDAMRTQDWQLRHFLAFEQGDTSVALRRLFGI